MMSVLKKVNDEIEKNEQNLKIFEKNDYKRIEILQNKTKHLLRLEEMVLNFLIQVEG